MGGEKLELHAFLKGIFRKRVQGDRILSRLREATLRVDNIYFKRSSSVFIMGIIWSHLSKDDKRTLDEEIKDSFPDERITPLDYSSKNVCQENLLQKI